jgi:hypothetical protein
MYKCYIWKVFFIFISYRYNENLEKVLFVVSDTFNILLDNEVAHTSRIKHLFMYRRSYAIFSGSNFLQWQNQQCSTLDHVSANYSLDIDSCLVGGEDRGAVGGPEGGQGDRGNVGNEGG